MAKKRKGDSSGKQGVMPVMRADAAGIDIGATEIFVAVPPDRTPENVRSFPDLYAGSVRAGGVADAVWSENSSHGVHGRVLDPAVSDFGGAWV